MKRIAILLFLLVTSTISCTVVDSELLELVLEIKNQNEELLDEVKSLQAKSDSLLIEIKENAVKQEELLEQVNLLQVELAEVMSQINALTEQMNSQDADLEAIKEQLADLQEKYESILVELEQLQQINQILIELETLKGQLLELDEKYQLILESLSQNEEELNALSVQIENLQSQLAEYLSSISELTSQLGEQGADIESILVQLEEVTNNCEEIKKLLDELLSGKSPVPSSGLLAWFPFNGNANDESGNGNNGSVNGAVLVSDRSASNSNAYSFDGINDFIQTSFDGVLGNKERTLSFWAKTTVTNATDGMAAVSFGPNGLGTRFDGYFNYQEVGATANIGGAAITYNSPSPINNDQWHHYIFMIDTPEATVSTVKVFQNGVLLNEVLATFNTPSVPIDTQPGFPMVIGKSNYVGIPGYFKGELDDIGVWNRALTDEEILKIYNGEGF